MNTHVENLETRHSVLIGTIARLTDTILNLQQSVNSYHAVLVARDNGHTPASDAANVATLMAQIARNTEAHLVGNREVYQTLTRLFPQQGPQSSPQAPTPAAGVASPSQHTQAGILHCFCIQVQVMLNSLQLLRKRQTALQPAAAPRMEDRRKLTQVRDLYFGYTKR